MLEPLVREARQKWPDRAFVISSTSRTGFELARKRFPEDTVTYAPLDFSWAVRQALRRLKPDMLVLVELELWPNLVSIASEAGVQLAIVNGRLSAKSYRGYRRIRGVVALLLRRFDFIAAQNASYAKRFCALGALPDRVQITGSMKFDGARTQRDNPRTRRLATWARLRPTESLFIAGSTQSPEERYALETYLALKPDFPELRLALVPRHPERFDEVAQLLESWRVPFQRRSASDDWGDDNEIRSADQVLLVDTVGELARLVGRGGHWLRRRQLWSPGRAKHDRTGGDGRRHVFWPKYRELPRSQRCAGRGTGGRGCGESGRDVSVRSAVPCRRRLRVGDGRSGRGLRAAPTRGACPDRRST